jgi:ribonuclease BN (tRNA processing enzyme)
VDVTVLGSSAAWPGPGRAAAGLLLQHEGTSVALDLGTGTLSNLQLRIPHDALDAVVVTHQHLDHVLDLYPLFVARLDHPDRLAPLALYAPLGVFDAVAVLEDEEGKQEMRETFDVREEESGATFEVGPLRFTLRSLPHSIPNLGIRVEADGAVLAYTGDTGPGPEIEELARGVDVLVSEASWEDDDGILADGHLTAQQAGRHAAGAGAGHLVLTHFWSTVDRDRARSLAADAFGREVVIGDENLHIEVVA